MIRSVLLFSAVFFIVFIIGFSIHDFFIQKQQISLPFSLKKVYLFHLFFSLIICINFLIFSNFNKFFEQLGFIYLGTILLKLTLFCSLFYTSIFTEEELALSSRISLLIPVVLFLITEATIVAKILKKK
tara:strand:- start:365 stop:751 length:387 start_codon:yes stop_codon:yes gene_type:complete